MLRRVECFNRLGEVVAHDAVVKDNIDKTAGAEVKHCVGKSEVAEVG